MSLLLSTCGRKGSMMGRTEKPGTLVEVIQPHCLVKLFASIFLSPFIVLCYYFFSMTVLNKDEYCVAEKLWTRMWTVASDPRQSIRTSRRPSWRNRGRQRMSGFVGSCPRWRSHPGRPTYARCCSAAVTTYQLGQRASTAAKGRVR